jgi:MoaA/NifB/PqqE/SkfB family radical SAM enzyme
MWIAPNTLNFAYVSGCNLRCTTCYAWKNKWKQSDDFLLGIRNFLYDFVKYVNLPYRVVFSGGEPLMDPHLNSVVDLIVSLGMGVQITTNGILLDENRIGDLVARGVEMFTLPLESLCSYEHDIIRPWHGSHFDLVQKRIELLQQMAPKTRLHLNTILTNHNYKNVGNLVKWVSNHPYIKGINFSVVMQPFHSDFSDDWHSDSGVQFDNLWAEDVEAFCSSIEVLSKLKADGAPIDNPVGQLNSFIEYAKNPSQFIHSVCPVADNGLILKDLGNLYYCQFKEPIGNIFEQSFEEIIESDEYREHIEQMLKCRDNCHLCVNCFYRGPYTPE